jgi:hypothetical protein
MTTFPACVMARTVSSFRSVPLISTSVVHRRSDDGSVTNDLFSFVAVGIVDVVYKLTQYYIILNRTVTSK